MRAKTRRAIPGSTRNKRVAMGMPQRRRRVESRDFAITEIDFSNEVSDPDDRSNRAHVRPADVALSASGRSTSCRAAWKNSDTSSGLTGSTEARATCPPHQRSNWCVLTVRLPGKGPLRCHTVAQDSPDGRRLRAASGPRLPRSRQAHPFRQAGPQGAASVTGSKLSRALAPVAARRRRDGRSQCAQTAVIPGRRAANLSNSQNPIPA
jgi:hypothetical protein